MKFFKMFESRIMNEADDMSVDVGGFDGDSFDTDNGLIETSSEDAIKHLGLDPTKYGLDKEEVAETPDEESQGSDEGEEAGQVTDEKSILDLVNSLGAVHNENPIKVESPEELKNLIQMGKDYTLKTQSLSEERKAWEAEKSSAEEEITKAIEEFNTNQQNFSKQIQELQQWTFALNELRDNAPDVFEEVQRAFNGVQKQFSNPIINQQLEAVNKRLSEAEAKLSQRESKLIVDQFESEKASLSATEQSMKELGITIDWTKVKGEWANSGQPLKSVIGGLYFDQIAKAQASKSKVETTKAKVAAKPAGAASASRPGGKVPAINRKQDYFAQALELYNSFK